MSPKLPTGLAGMVLTNLSVVFVTIVFPLGTIFSGYHVSMAPPRVSQNPPKGGKKASKKSKNGLKTILNFTCWALPVERPPGGAIVNGPSGQIR